MLPNIFLLVLSLIFIVLQNSSDFMSAFFNLMSFGCACAYALTMVSAVCIHRKHPEWKSSNTVKGGDAHDKRTNDHLASILLSVIF